MIVNFLCVLCYHNLLILQAYKRGMTYPRYTFISYYWYSSYWWTDIDDNTNCTVQELTDAIFRSLSVDHFPSPTEEEMSQTTDVGYVRACVCVCVCVYVCVCVCVCVSVCVRV